MAWVTLRSVMRSSLRRCRPQLTGARPAGVARRDEPCLRQRLRGLRPRGPGEGERRGELAHRGRPAAEPLQDGAPRGVRERMEHMVEDRLFVKQVLKYH